jgi:2-polyprenyl-6-hydroxyphenyl methylase/3-demethylubiquinone-9 3-methyltransferase
MTMLVQPDHVRTAGGSTHSRTPDDRLEGPATRLVLSPSPRYGSDHAETAPRFAFGRNWRQFLATVDDERLQHAEASLQKALGRAALSGLTFLDVGSGSGLFSLAACRLGARVTSFDFDAESVGCTEAVRQYAGADEHRWQIRQGSILDPAFVQSLGQFDIVYAWGVLHHTGALWQALTHAGALVAPQGTLLVAIYNDQGAWSTRWWRIKRWYGRGGLTRAVIIGGYASYSILRNFVADCLWGRLPWRRYVDYRRQRGMSVWHDWLDWLGGFPFEVAKPEQVFHYMRSHGFTLQDFTTQGGSVGCVEYRFQHDPTG